MLADVVLAVLPVDAIRYLPELTAKYHVARTIRPCEQGLAGLDQPLGHPPRVDLHLRRLWLVRHRLRHDGMAARIHRKAHELPQRLERDLDRLAFPLPLRHHTALCVVALVRRLRNPTRDRDPHRGVPRARLEHIQHLASPEADCADVTTTSVGSLLLRTNRMNSFVQ